MKLPKSQKGFTPIFLVFGLIVLLSLIAGGYRFFNKSSAEKNIITQNNSNSVPTDTLSTTKSKNSPYKYGLEIHDLGFYLAALGAGYDWKVNYRDEGVKNNKHTFVFDFAPPGWVIPDGYSNDYMGWGGYRIIVEPPASDINTFIEKNLSELKPYGPPIIKPVKIDNQSGYSVEFKEGEDGFPGSKTQVILRKRYSYEIIWAVQQSAVKDYSQYDKLEKPYFVFTEPVAYTKCSTDRILPDLNVQCSDYDKYKDLYISLLSTSLVQTELRSSYPGPSDSCTLALMIWGVFKNDIVYTNVSYCSGHALWLQKVNNEWKKIYTGQQAPPCSLIENLKIESGVDCLDDSINDGSAHNRKTK